MKKTLKHLLPALFLAAAMALLTGCTKSVDLLQYADVTFDGASGNATATVTLDYNGLGKELFGKGKDQDIWDEAQTELSLMGHVNYTVTPQTGLSNGDTVTLTVSADDAFLKNHEITLSETSKTLIVSGLKEPETIDPFEDSLLNIAVEGETVSGKLNILVRGCAPHLGVTVSSDLPADVMPRAMSSPSRPRPSSAATSPITTFSPATALKFPWKTFPTTSTPPTK